MKKPTSWDLCFQKQLGDPEMRGLIDEEVESLRVGIQIARWRQKKGLLGRGVELTFPARRSS